MTADDALGVYLREQWAVLLRYVAVLGVDPDGAEALLTRTVTRIAAGGRVRRLPTGDALDHYVRRRLVRACIANGRRRVAESTSQHQVQIRYVDQRSGSPTRDAVDAVDAVDPVRAAVAELPAGQRVALVLRYAEGVDDATAAGLMGCKVAQQREQLTKGLQSLVDLLAVDRAGSVPGDGSSRTESLLRAMLDQIPTPATAPEPLAGLPRTVNRLLRQRLAVAAAAIAVVVVAIVAALPQGGSSTATAPPASRFAAMDTAQPVALPREPYAYPGGVVAGGGYLWTVELHPGARHPGTFIERRDPTTGREEVTYHVPEEDFTIAYGLGRVWTWGGGYRPGEPTIISTIDPSTGVVRSTAVVPRAGITDVAFAAGRAWFTEPVRGRVLIVNPHHLADRTSIGIVGARDVVPVSASSVVVSGTTGLLHQLPSNVVLGTPMASLSKLAAAPAYGVWIAHGRLLTYQPAIDAPLTTTLHLPFTVSGVMGDPQHGVYVALAGSKPQLNAPYLVYYSAEALRAARPRPTAVLNGHIGVSSMAPGPAGEVVFVTFDGGVWGWSPLHQMRSGDRSFATASALR